MKMLDTRFNGLLAQFLEDPTALSEAELLAVSAAMEEDIADREYRLEMLDSRYANPNWRDQLDAQCDKDTGFLN